MFRYLHHHHRIQQTDTPLVSIFWLCLTCNHQQSREEEAADKFLVALVQNVLMNVFGLLKFEGMCINFLKILLLFFLPGIQYELVGSSIVVVHDSNNLSTYV